MLPTFTLPLPSVGSLSEVASYNATVAPFHHQLYDLPGKFLQHATSFNDLKLLYLSTNPLIMAFAISLALSPIFLVISEINKNYSQVDRVWSILPSKSKYTHPVMRTSQLTSSSQLSISLTSTLGLVSPACQHLASTCSSHSASSGAHDCRSITGVKEDTRKAQKTIAGRFCARRYPDHCSSFSTSRSSRSLKA